MQSILSSFFLIFIAEMGDKTQLMAMAFAARFKVTSVILAISAATVLNNLIAVIAGNLISGVFSADIIKTVSFVLFILFGLWTMHGESGEEEDKNKKVIVNPFFTVAVLFFVSEFGDKTQIATMTLAMNQTALYVLIGSSLGMICANLIGICVGMVMCKKVPSHIIRWVSAGLFIAIGFIGFGTVFFNLYSFGKAFIYESAVILITLVLSVIIIRKGEKK